MPLDLAVLKDFVEKNYSLEGRLKDNSKASIKSLKVDQEEQAEETNGSESDSAMELSDNELCEC